MPHLPPSHADHDPLAIAAYAAGDATGPELDDALALVAACADCAALHHDLRAIASALPGLPAPARSRDFRLTPEQAASLRPAGWRRLLAPFAGPKFAFAGPVGAGLATLGLAGILVADRSASPSPPRRPPTAVRRRRAMRSRWSARTRAVPPSCSPRSRQPLSRCPPRRRRRSAWPRRGGSRRRGARKAAPVGDAQGEVAITEAGPGPTADVEADKTASGVAPETEPVPVVPMLSAIALLIGVTLVALRYAGRRAVSQD